MRSGKRLPKRVTEIAIQFNAAPLAIFNGDETTTAPNLLILRIQPEEGISLKFLSKRPGAGMKLRPVSMDFNYGSSFGERSPSAYETLLLDAIIGDATLYTRQDMVEASWTVVDAIQHVWDNTKFDFPQLRRGHLGTQGRRRNAGAARPRVEAAVMAAGGTIAPESILHDMADLWVTLGKEGEGDAGVLRACSMTLVVAAEESDDAQAIGETLAALMPEHPSRAIVIRFTRRRTALARGPRVRAVLDALRTAPADLLRADRDHRFGCQPAGSGRRGAAAGRARSAGDSVVPRARACSSLPAFGRLAPSHKSGGGQRGVRRARAGPGRDERRVAAGTDGGRSFLDPPDALAGTDRADLRESRAPGGPAPKCPRF